MRTGKKKAELLKKSRELDMPVDSIFAQPVIHIIGRTHFEVENRKSITEYTENAISLDMGLFSVRFVGDGITLRDISKSTLIIDGEIERIELTKGANNEE